MLILIQSKNAKYCLAEYIEQNDAEKKQIIGYSFNKNMKRTFIKKKYGIFNYHFLLLYRLGFRLNLYLLYIQI